MDAAAELEMMHEVLGEMRSMIDEDRGCPTLAVFAAGNNRQMTAYFEYPDGDKVRLDRALADIGRAAGSEVVILAAHSLMVEGDCADADAAAADPNATAVVLCVAYRRDGSDSTAFTQRYTRGDDGTIEWELVWDFPFVREEPTGPWSLLGGTADRSGIRRAVERAKATARPEPLIMVGSDPEIEELLD